MAKKAAAPKAAPAADKNKQLVDAIITVKQLQDFIKEHGSLDKALGAVNRVYGLIELTGGIGQLTQALEIVGREETPESAEQPQP
jgi:hypothetical protein